MNPRRVICIVVSLVLLVIIGYMFEGGKTPTGLGKELILNDFVDIRDNEIPEGTMGGSFYVTNVCFLLPDILATVIERPPSSRSEERRVERV